MFDIDTSLAPEKYLDKFIGQAQMDFKSLAYKSLNGSPKQRKWAEELRRDFITYFTHSYVELCRYFLAECVITNTSLSQGVISNYAQYYRDGIHALADCTSSDWFIKHRQVRENGILTLLLREFGIGLHISSSLLKYFVYTRII